MQSRRASIKESGEELTPAEWERFDAGVAQGKAERRDDAATIPDAPTRLPADGDEAHD